MDGGELIIFCLFRKFIVIGANRDYKCSAVNFPFSHEPWCPSYFFTAYSRFIFILFRFFFFCCLFRLGSLVAGSLLISSQLKIFSQ